MNAHVEEYLAYKKHIEIVWGIGLPSEPKIYIDYQGNEHSNGLTIEDMLSGLESADQSYVMEA